MKRVEIMDTINEVDTFANEWGADILCSDGHTI
jgi:hypothetical protein